MNQIVDYTKCPNCNSSDVRRLSAEEWEAEKNNLGSGNRSTADELKKFKGLLDSGAITQEEYEA